jgi:cytochrome c oxidase cbb3-type subunit 4
MDINTIRIAITLLSLAAFLCIVAWAMSPAKRQEFEEAARLPLIDDDEGGDRNA